MLAPCKRFQSIKSIESIKNINNSLDNISKLARQECIFLRFNHRVRIFMIYQQKTTPTNLKPAAGLTLLSPWISMDLHGIHGSPWHDATQ